MAAVEAAAVQLQAPSDRQGASTFDLIAKAHRTLRVNERRIDRLRAPRTPKGD